MTISFQVSKVKRAKNPLRMPHEEAAGGAPPKVLGRPVEAWASNASRFLPTEEHAFLRAVHLAYSLHYPLVLTPDAIWLCIAQGFAMHVKQNAERLRGKFVRHEGQANLAVRRDDFVKGSPENPWGEVMRELSDAIAAHIGRQRDLVVCGFSTTGPCERVASEIVLMDAMQRYFSYKLMTFCGIPEITLEGTVDDWRSIRRRAQALEEYELDWWTEALGPVLDQFIAAASGKVNGRFWRALFKHDDMSGGPYVTGWINVLFPYLLADEEGALEENPAATEWSSSDMDDLPRAEQKSIPSGISTVPFLWEYLGSEYSMELLGGFVGVAQDAGTLALRPAIGWAVADAQTRGPREEEEEE